MEAVSVQAGEGDEVTWASPATINRVIRDVFTLGLYEFWYRRTEYLVDDECVDIHRGILSREEIRIPASKIVGVKTQLSPLPGCSAVTIDTGAGVTAQATSLTRRDARVFADACRETAARAQRS